MSAKCCYLDTDGDGNCPVHAAPRVSRDSILYSSLYSRGVVDNILREELSGTIGGPLTPKADDARTIESNPMMGAYVAFKFKESNPKSPLADGVEKLQALAGPDFDPGAFLKILEGEE